MIMIIFTKHNYFLLESVNSFIKVESYISFTYVQVLTMQMHFNCIAFADKKNPNQL